MPDESSLRSSWFRRPLSRRALLGATPAAGVLALGACTTERALPQAGPAEDAPATYRFFTPEEIRAMDALTSRIMAVGGHTGGTPADVTA